MKIAIPSMGPSLESPYSHVFGRAPYFLIVDENGNLLEALQNPGYASRGGAGIATANFLVGKGVNVVLTASIGPNAFRVLSSVGIQLVGISAPTAKEAFNAYKSGNVVPLGISGGRGFGRGMGLGRGFRGGRGWM